MHDQVRVSLRVKASPARAFAVFTEEIAAWWRPNPMFALTPRSPGRMAFEPGVGGRLVEILPSGKVFEVGVITVWEPGARLVFGWRTATFAPDWDGLVEVVFEPVGEETRVTVIHSGWLKVPRDHVARHGFPDVVFLQRYGEWWRSLLAALAQTVGPDG